MAEKPIEGGQPAIWLKPRVVIGILLALSVAVGALEVTTVLRVGWGAETAQTAWGLAFLVLSIAWVYADSTMRGFHRPFEFGYVLWLLWPVVFPWYLARTRGAEGLVLFTGFVAIWLGPWLAGLVAYLYLT